MKRPRTEDTEDRTNVKRYRCEQDSATLSQRQAFIASESFISHNDDEHPDKMGSRQVGDLLGVGAVTDFLY